MSVSYTHLDVYKRQEFSDLHAYTEEVMGRPIFTHEFPYIAEELKEKSKKDFTSIKIEDDLICPYPLSM